MVSLFVYNNDTFIVESFLDEPVEVQIVTDDRMTTLTDLITGRTVTAGSVPQGPWGRISGKRFEVALPPHSYRVFQGEK